MLFSALIGLIFRDTLNPFINGIDNKEKVSKSIQIAIIIGFLTLISSFMKSELFNIFRGLVVTLLLVNIPIGIFLFVKKEKKLVNDTILFNGLIVAIFIIIYVSFLLTLPPYYYRREEYSFYYPLSYPLIFIQYGFFPPPPNFTITNFLDVLLPVKNILISTGTFNHFENGDSITLEKMQLETQVFVFVIFYIVNYATTIITLKVYTKNRKNKQKH